MPGPHVLPEVVERFLDEPVAAPSLPDLRAAGAATLRRRRRRRGLVGGAAAVVLVVGGVAVGQAALSGNGDRSDDPTPQPADTTIEPPPGTRWAGIGRVVMAVPEGWKDRRTLPCRPTAPAVYFPSDQVRHCMLTAPASSLMISDRSLNGPGESPGELDGQVDGHDVLIRSELCAEPTVMTCSLDVSVPDLGAYFRITVHGRYVWADLDAMRDSLTVLPAGQAAIPLVESWHRFDVEDAYATMEKLGLEPTIEDWCSDGLCSLSAWTDPPAGRVVAAGTPVTIYVVGWGDGPDPYPLDALTCEGNQRVNSDIDVIPPRSAKEARELGWPTDPLAAVEGVPGAFAWRDLGIVDVTLLDSGGDGESRISGQNAAGRTVIIMTVQELVEGAWAMTAEESCSE